MANNDGEDGEHGGVLVVQELLTSALLVALHTYLEGLPLSIGVTLWLIEKCCYLGLVGEGVRPTCVGCWQMSVY